LAAKLDEDFIESCGSSVLQALPAGLSGYGFSPDTQAGMVKFAEVVPSPQIPGNVLNKPMAGQLFPPWGAEHWRQHTRRRTEFSVLKNIGASLSIMPLTRGLESLTR
jgi:hypothetical protein